MHDDMTDMDKDVTNTIAATLKLNPEKYRHHFENDELSIEQQNDLLEALWHIFSIFVDIGWGVDTVQMFLPELSGKELPDSGKLIESKDTNISKQADASGKGRQNE